MKILFILVLLTATLNSDAATGTNDIAFVTQDTNGVHFVTLVSSPSWTRAVVRTISGTSRGEGSPVSYPADRFAEVWTKLNSAEFERYRVPAEGNMDQSNHYLFMVRSPEATRGYRIPKCGIDPDVFEFVVMAVGGLLPEGSPGLFEPCQSSQ